MNLKSCYLSFLFFVIYIITISNGFPVREVPFLSLEHIDPTLPPVLPGHSPACSAVVLQQDFVDIGSPLISANYTHPRGCPFPWARLVLELSLSASEMHKHRTAAVWIDGAEVLRTTGPVPMAPGAFWKVQKDVTHYSTLFRQLGVMYLMLENSDDTLPGVYNANVSLHFYRNSNGKSNNIAVISHPNIKGLYPESADLILPISDKNGYFGSGFWFKINNDSHVVKSDVNIPMNTYRAVLEIFVSYHGSDEDWYTNPFRTSDLNQPRNLAVHLTNGGFRQVYATIDNKFVGGHIPFAVIYPGSMNPFLWSPVASIGSFDMPSYDLDITPFLSLLLDGQAHNIGLGVRDAKPYWLVSANVHLWIDKSSESCHAGLIFYKQHPLKVNRDAKWKSMNGQSRVDAEGVHKYVGWVSSSIGNLTTVVEQKTKFTSQIEVSNQGLVKEVEMTNKEKIDVEVRRGDQTLRQVQLLIDAPLTAKISRSSVDVGSMFSGKTRLSHQLEETMDLFEDQETRTSRLIDHQDAEGSTSMRDGQLTWESGSTRSHYKYRDRGTCYVREVNTAGGLIMLDKGTPCAEILVSEI